MATASPQKCIPLLAVSLQVHRVNPWGVLLSSAERSHLPAAHFKTFKALLQITGHEAREIVWKMHTGASCKALMSLHENQCCVVGVKWFTEGQRLSRARHRLCSELRSLPWVSCSVCSTRPGGIKRATGKETTNTENEEF